MNREIDENIRVINLLHLIQRVAKFIISMLD